jgi:hypothetical protein
MCTLALRTKCEYLKSFGNARFAKTTIASIAATMSNRIHNFSDLRRLTDGFIARHANGHI